MQQQLMEVVRAQELYYTTHGEYAYKFDDLEWKPILPAVKNPTEDGEIDLADVVGNEQIILGLSTQKYTPLVVSTAILQTGPYSGSGFRYIHHNDETNRYGNKKLYCVDPFSNFCKTVMGLPNSWIPGYGLNAYLMN